MKLNLKISKFKFIGQEITLKAIHKLWHNIHFKSMGPPDK